VLAIVINSPALHQMKVDKQKGTWSKTKLTSSWKAKQKRKKKQTQKQNI